MVVGASPDLGDLNKAKIQGLDNERFVLGARPTSCAYDARLSLPLQHSPLLHFSDALELSSFTLFKQDYGAPIGMRLAIARPSAIQGMIFQNGNVYADGLGAIWAERRKYWADRAAYEAELRQTHLSLAATRGHHVGSDPRLEAYDHDLWSNELAYSHSPGIADVQMDLIYDYRTKIESYPSSQNWLRFHQHPTLVIWGRHDVAFTVLGATAFQRDLPDTAVHILEAGHFAPDTHLDQVVLLTRDFLDRLHGGEAAAVARDP